MQVHNWWGENRYEGLRHQISNTYLSTLWSFTVAQIIASDFEVQIQTIRHSRNNQNITEQHSGAFE